MINTSRIASGFDIELQLAAGWFMTAINLLIEKGVISIPGIPIIITETRISGETDWHLEIDVIGLDDPVLARATLNDDGSEITLTFNINEIPDQVIPFGALDKVIGTPVLVKCLSDDAEFESVLAILANIELNTADQSEEPLSDDEVLQQVRGSEANALTFLPSGSHVGFGMGRETYQRFANHLWHTELRAGDGTHPLPDENDRKGTWHSVSMHGEGGTITIRLDGEVPIDLWPDADVTITLTLTPTLTDGVLSFTIESDTNVDTGILGDIFAFFGGGIAGGIIGFVVGLITGGILVAVLVGASIGAVVGVIVLEIVEVVVEGIVQKQIKAKINGEPLEEIHCNEDGIVQIATPDTEGFNLSFLDAIPSSIAINTANLENEPLYKRTLLVKSLYNEVEADANGFAVTGLSAAEEKFQPEVISLVDATYLDDDLLSLTFRTDTGEEQQLTKEEVISRAAEGELKPGFKLFSKPEDATLRIPEGKLACICLKPIAIRQLDTVVEEIEFENGVRLRVRDAIELQDAGALIVQGYQLIHPRDYNAYYRAKADFFKDNNFESLPEFTV
ncbi:MAG TPA: hypothetical protein VFZ47_07015 [Chitinophagaceae bacterium]